MCPVCCFVMFCNGFPAANPHDVLEVASVLRAHGCDRVWGEGGDSMNKGFSFFPSPRKTLIVL